MLIGPNTGLGHTSVVVMAEFQIEYVLDALRVMQARGVGVAEVRACAQAAYNADVERKLEGTVWTSRGCTSRGRCLGGRSRSRRVGVGRVGVG